MEVSEETMSSGDGYSGVVSSRTSELEASCGDGEGRHGEGCESRKRENIECI